MAILTNKATGIHVILHLLFLVIEVTKILYETSTSNSSTCNYIMIDNSIVTKKQANLLVLKLFSTVYCIVFNCNSVKTSNHTPISAAIVVYYYEITSQQPIRFAQIRGLSQSLRFFPRRSLAQGTKLMGNLIGQRASYHASPMRSLLPRRKSLTL